MSFIKETENPVNITSDFNANLINFCGSFNMSEKLSGNSFLSCYQLQCPVELLPDFWFKFIKENQVVILVVENVPNKFFFNAAKLSN